VHDLVDATRRDANSHSKAMLSYAERLEVFVQEHLARMDRRHDRGFVHSSFLVVVNDLDIPGTGSAPSKTYAPLLIDADAVLTSPIAFELFQAVPRRHAQISKGIRGIEN
jgi:hypothetical protein